MYRQQLGCHIRVVISASDVESFKRVWPCSGLGARGFSVQFDRRNGDLVDSSAPISWDGAALAALVEDAKDYAFKGEAPAYTDVIVERRA